MLQWTLLSDLSPSPNPFLYLCCHSLSLLVAVLDSSAQGSHTRKVREALGSFSSLHTKTIFSSWEIVIGVVPELYYTVFQIWKVQNQQKYQSTYWIPSCPTNFKSTEVFIHSFKVKEVRTLLVSLAFLVELDTISTVYPVLSQLNLNRGVKLKIKEFFSPCKRAE